MKFKIFISLAVILLVFSFISAEGIFTIANKSDSTQTYFSVNGSTGNVGIGTIIPSSTLQVIGDITQSTGLSLIQQIIYTGRKQNFAGNNGLGQSAGVKNTWMTPVMTNYTNGYGDKAFQGGVFDGENIWIVPFDSNYLVKVNPATGEMTNYSQGYGDLAFAGGVFDGENIWLVPSDSNYLVKVNPATGEMTNYSADYGISAFVGGVFDGENIWLVPFASTKLVKVNPSTGEMTNYSQGYGSAAFVGGVFDGENIWLVPYSSNSLVKVNPSTGEMTNYSVGYGTAAFYGGAFDGENIWLVPYFSDYLVKVNPSTGEMTNYSQGYGAVAFFGGVFDGENIWLVPSISTKLVKVNPSTGAMTNYSQGYRALAFAGGVFDGENIWLVPYFSDYLVKVRPQEFGRESLFTGGSASIGTNLIVGNTFHAGDGNLSTVFNSIGNPAGSDDSLNGNNDLYVADDLEVDGTMYLTGGYTSIVNSDIAEVLLTKKARESILCEGEPECIVGSYEKELEYGDIVCIDERYGQVIKKCNESNSKLVAGVVSNTSKINMGNNLKYGYPIAVAGIVFTKVSNENGDIHPGDLLVSSSKPGFAMKAPDDYKIGTILGKAYDFCDSRYNNECVIPMFVLRLK